MAYRKTRGQRMVRLALKLKRLHTPFVDRIAEVATREKEENEIFVLTQADVFQIEQCCPELAGRLHDGVSVRIDYPHLAHLDNSGHLFGIANDNTHTDDLSPLHALDFFSIPNLVRKPKKVFFFEDSNQIRFEKRRLGATLRLVLEIDTDYNCLYFITMYHKSHSHKAGAQSPYAAHYEKAASSSDSSHPCLDSIASETKTD